MSPTRKNVISVTLPAMTDRVDLRIRRQPRDWKGCNVNPAMDREVSIWQCLCQTRLKREPLLRLFPRIVVVATIRMSLIKQQQPERGSKVERKIGSVKIIHFDNPDKRDGGDFLSPPFVFFLLHIKLPKMFLGLVDDYNQP